MIAIMIAVLVGAVFLVGVLIGVRVSDAILRRERDRLAAQRRRVTYPVP